MSRKTESAHLATQLADQAKRSGLSEVDKTAAMARAAKTLVMMGSSDPVDRLATSLVNWAITMSKPMNGDALEAHLAATAIDLDVAAIEMEGVNHGDGIETRKACNSILKGTAYNLGNVSDQGARPLVDEIIAEIGETEDFDRRHRAAVALLDSVGRADETSTIGCDEMLMGLFGKVLPLVKVTLEQLAPTTSDRISRCIRQMF